jgi:hypothetical protein
MLMDQTGTSLYFGSSHELMVYSTATNTLSKEDVTVPGVVLAVAPNAQTVLINDQSRHVFYLYATTSGLTTATFGGIGSYAQWTPDGKTLYVSDSAAAGPGHSDTLYVYNANTGWTTYDLSSSGGAERLAVMVPGVGAYLSGNPTVAHTWCPSGTVGNYNSMVFYPQGDSVNAQTDVLAATADGQHILGAAFAGGGISLSDIGITLPTTTSPTGILTPTPCPISSGGALSPLTVSHTLAQTSITANATSVNQIVTSPAAVTQGSSVAPYSLSFITYDGTTTGATLPYYKQAATNTSALGTVGYVTLAGSSAITAPIAGAFSPDDSQFFVSTAGDNKVHYINTTTFTDTQQITPNLPPCTPGADLDCQITTPITGSVPATAIAVKPRSTT